jgi:hypothetical protein
LARRPLNFKERMNASSVPPDKATAAWGLSVGRFHLHSIGVALPSKALAKEQLVCLDL